jgi:hypothetical protein
LDGLTFLRLLIDYKRSETITREIIATMNELIEENLYDILDKLSTRLVQLYYVNSWELDDQDGMRVSGNILYARNFYNE